MKTLQLICSVMILLCTMMGSLQAQAIDSTNIKTTPPVIAAPTKAFLVAGRKDTLWLSRVPTVFELTRIFAEPGKGPLDPFLALQAVIGKGDSAVGALDSLLFSDPIAEVIVIRTNLGARAEAGIAGQEVVKADTVRPNKLYAVMALEAIGSKVCYPVLFRLAQLHPNKDVRGIALHALSTTFHEAVRLQKFVPDKQLVHLLLLNVDDTTSVPYLSKSFGQIAREGLVTWLGQDFGEPQGTAKRLRDAKGSDGETLAEYRETWWQLNGSKIAWDSEWEKFTIK